MDLNSLLGPVLALGLILIGFGMDGGQLDQMVSATSFLIVFGGSLGAMMVAYSMPDFILSFRAVGDWLRLPAGEPKLLLSSILDLSQAARKTSLIALEDQVQGIKYLPLQKAVRMAIDGQELEAIQKNLEAEKRIAIQESNVAVQFWDDFGSFTPTIGILGAVLGLIHAMTMLDQPQSMGSSIALAFTATLYGVGAANLIFIPISKKLRRKSECEERAREMVIVGIEGIVNRTNPKLIEEKLTMYLDYAA